MKLKMMKGLPGSGKSTVSKNLVKQSGNAGRVNRDDLRAMIFDGVWSGKREEIIIEVEKAIAKVLIDNKLMPIIDDTNLSPKHRNLWETFANQNNLQFDVDDQNTDLLTCIQRDKNRDKPVGAAIIQRMALENGMIDFGTKPIIIVDIDGTIADGEQREHFLHGIKKDWNSYFEAMIYDAPIQHIIDWVNELAKDYTICIVSGRPDTHQQHTIAWLQMVANISYDYIFMRRGNDKRPDVDVKTDILKKLPKEQILFVIDDRPSVVNGCWRKNGVKVIPVRGECEDF